jgi:glycerol-3-phosphate O-acyltransferase
MPLENTIYTHLIPDIQDWPIYKFSESREAFIKELTDHVLSKMANNPSISVKDVLRKSIFQEQKRVKTRPWKVDPSDEKSYWSSLGDELESTTNSDNTAIEELKILRRIINRYSEEIIGHFKPSTHNFARVFLTAFFKRLYNNGWGRGHKWIWGSKDDLLSKIKIKGHTEELRAMFDLGTVVMVPTHYSNLDSIQIAYGIDTKAGLPAFAYGAGLNLYDTEILAYYMNRLGAYRVDRRKKNPIYLETLKAMASLSLMHGLNHIFFPGGTRSRSGSIEDKLKLGLLNSVIDAQRNSYLENKDQRIFIVPLSIGYHFVLEAESLIDQHLRIIGQEKYTRKKNKSSKIKTAFSFLRSLRKYDSDIYLSFGKPMDIMGNKVDISGNSYDSRGHLVDVRSYFSKDDVLNVDSQRESVYTKVLAERIVASFKKNNIILSSHLVAYAMFTLLQDQYSDKDLFEILKIPVKSISISMELMVKQVNKILTLLKNRESAVTLSEEFDDTTTEKLIRVGVGKVGVYHTKKVIKFKSKSKLGTEDLNLLYYYHNKLIHYNLPINRK